jgi:hypothetical protein
VRQQAIAALEAHGVALRPITRLVSDVGAKRYTISVVQVIGVSIPPTVFKAPPETGALKLSTEVLNYDLASLVEHCAHAVYGKSVAGGESTPVGVVRTTDPKDHFATTFQSTQGFGSIAAVEITVLDQSVAKQYGPVNMIVQDQDYRTLYSSGTLAGGQATTLVGLPVGTRAIRIAFLANDDGYIRFPLQVRMDAFKATSN